MYLFKAIFSLIVSSHGVTVGKGLFLSKHLLWLFLMGNEARVLSENPFKEHLSASAEEEILTLLRKMAKRPLI